MKQEIEERKICKTKTAKGITLVALVITVIILIILAGITIAGLTGEKGLIKEAKTAKELTELASLEEQIELAIIKAEQKHRNPTIDDVIEEIKNNKVISNENQVNKETGAVHTDAGYLIEGKLDDYIGKISIGDENNTGTGNTTGNNTTNGGTTETPSLPSTSDTKPFLPTGATQVEGTNLDTGLVIKDSNDNEWVWIEVPKSIYAFSNVNYTDIEKTLKEYSKDYSDNSYSDVFVSKEHQGFDSSTDYNDWKNSMLESIFNNGGFYIGRYEMGTDTPRFSGTAELTTPYIKQDMYPYNYITCSQAQTKAKELATGGKISSLMFGIQWDLVLKFIETKGGKTQTELKIDSTSWGNYSNATFNFTRGKYLSERTWNTTTNYTKSTNTEVFLTTGIITRNSALNIYDLTGNVYQWTLERYSLGGKPCAYRGGSYRQIGSKYPAFKRTSYNTTAGTSYITGYNSNDLGARTALW